jgi:hypothetical protein
MKRRPYGRDLGLTIRMGIALVPIVLWYLLMAALLVLVVIAVVANPSWETVLFLGLIAVGGPIALWEQFMNSESVALRAARAKEVDPDEHRELQELVACVAAQADRHARDGRAQILFVLFYWPFFFVGLLTMWTLSRYREYVADRSAAQITGAPEQLASALQKLAGRPARGDLRGGLAVQALCILPARTRGWRRFELLADHPPLEKRLERLEELSRELGKAA